MGGWVYADCRISGGWGVGGWVYRDSGNRDPLPLRLDELAPVANPGLSQDPGISCFILIYLLQNVYLRISTFRQKGMGGVGGWVYSSGKCGGWGWGDGFTEVAPREAPPPFVLPCY